MNKRTRFELVVPMTLAESNQLWCMLHHSPHYNRPIAKRVCRLINKKTSEVRSEEDRKLKVKLTKPQLEELRRLAKEPQKTYGRHRARVQNSLASKGLARLYDEARPNERASLVSILASSGIAPIYDTCEITDAGRQALHLAEQKA